MAQGKYLHEILCVVISLSVSTEDRLNLCQQPVLFKKTDQSQTSKKNLRRQRDERLVSVAFYHLNTKTVNMYFDGMRGQGNHYLHSSQGSAC